MKPQTIVVLALLVCQASGGVAGEERPPERSIELSFENDEYTLGTDFQLTVAYRNNAEEPWVIVDPEKSRRVVCHLLGVGAANFQAGYFLGRLKVLTMDTPEGKILRWFPPHHGDVNVVIPPGESHQFVLPFERDWIGAVHVGRWTAWIEDRNANLESNREEINLRFTGESIAICLRRARDKDNKWSMRRWHSDYLKKISPEFDIPWRPREEEVQRQLDQFEAFWKDPANAPAIEAAIERINREAGLLPEAQKEGGGEEAPGGGIHPDGHNEEDA